MKPNSKLALILTTLTIILTVLLSACSPAATPAPTADVNAIYTQAAATIVVGMTQTAAAMPPTATSTPVPLTATLEPSPTTDLALTTATTAPTVPPAVPATGSSPTPIAADPATAFGCYNASFVAHVTLPYAPAFNPGDKFTKTWRVKNTGSCDWPRGFQLVFVSGDRFGADTIIIGQKVIAGSFAEISLAMTAPHLGGVVTSNWQLATDIGKQFGQLLSVSITLPGTASGSTASGGCLSSSLISDVTVSSGTEFTAGEAFTKTWLIKNTGTCTWNRDYKIYFVGGDTLGSDTTKIRQVVAPGASAEISLNMVAPGKTGNYSSTWQMAADDGTLFGQSFAFSIKVK